MTEQNWAAAAPAGTLDLLRAAAEVDGRAEVVDLPKEFRRGEHTGVVRPDGLLVGHAHLNTDGDSFGRQVAEVTVHPAHRRQGLGTELVERVLAHAAQGVRFWSHGDHPAAAAIGAKLGLRRVRELLVMARDLDEELPEPVWPEGVRVRTFVPGQDEAAVVAVNKRAFDWHPEQGALTVADLEETERAGWFDPGGFFLAVDPDDELLGFHWTKVHPDGTGEVYVVGVDPSAQGGGLGKALTLVGIRHLRAVGRPRVILYVESDNHPAVAVYRRLGFTRSAADVQWGAAPTSSS
ncbi:mycothiol synthase [Actinokineospora pegani]|uniref:mycothiol synthase n=1 Tax=Actinokineospora pegani TaxID=2654637 RepID=UPI0012EA7AF0|nr:mycothiol synthase [Actinokineospora pegani]